MYSETGSDSQIWERFQVDPHQGFLPAAPPLTRLPEGYAPWERLAAHLPGWLYSGQLEKEIRDLPILSTHALHTPETRERAMLVLCFLASAYINGGSGPSTLPTPLARPLLELSRTLGRYPMLAHASLVLQNWRKLDPQGPMEAQNLYPLLMFHGSVDEAWFYMVTVAVEALGAQAIYTLVQLREALEQENISAIAHYLEKLEGHLHRMRAALDEMRHHCDPHIFYHRIRPYLGGFRNIRFETGQEERQVFTFSGGSAAQSSLLQAIDAALGIEHPEEAHQRFLMEMRHYMPPGHVRFIQFLGEYPAARFVNLGHPALKEALKACMHAVHLFRNAHLQLVAAYIIAPARAEGKAQVTGTGGTHPFPFLKSLRNDAAHGAR